MGHKYTNAPIIEVVCEIHFGADSEWDMTVPGLIYESVKDSLPKRQQIKVVVFKPSSGTGAEFTAIERMQFRSENELAFIQVSPHFLAINHLKPYPYWDDFSSIIQKGYNAYRAVTNPKTIERVGLRYINNIAFEEKTIELSDFFNFYPHVGTGFPENYVSFVTAIQTPFAQGRDILKIELTSRHLDQTNRSLEQGEASIILDLDYILMQPGCIKPDNVLDWVNEAHQRVEEAFEACITDSLREIFGKEGELGQATGGVDVVGFADNINATNYLHSTALAIQ